MALNTSRRAYEDIFRLLDQALASPKGIRIKIASEGAAKKMRSRIHYARHIDRKDNAQNFDFDHPMYDKSIYDPLSVRFVHERSFIWLYLENSGNAEYTVEEIPDEHQAPNGDNGTAEGEGSPPREGEEAPSEVAKVVSALRRI